MAVVVEVAVVVVAEPEVAAVEEAVEEEAAAVEEAVEDPPLASK